MSDPGLEMAKALAQDEKNREFLIHVFDYLKDNLTLSIDQSYSRDYGGPNGMSNYRTFTIDLKLTNPQTNVDEVISSESFSIDTGG